MIKKNLHLNFKLKKGDFPKTKGNKNNFFEMELLGSKSL